MKTAYGDFRVYKLVRGDETYTLFQTPDKDVAGYLEHASELHKLRNEGFVIMSVLHCDRETFLNLKIEDKVEDYLFYTKNEEDMMNQNPINEDSIRIIHECMETVLKALDMLVRRCQRYDYEVDNELALQLVDCYHKEV